MSEETAPPRSEIPPPPELRPARLSQNARTVLARRYLIRDGDGEPVESPEQLFWRVASVIAGIDSLYGAGEEEVFRLATRFYDAMADGAFMPNSPTLMNAGRPLGQLAACFVLPVEDALSNGRNGIYDTLRAMALVHQSGGGTGFSFSRIRPTGDQVRSTSGVASGPVSFMTLYDASTEVVKQGGTRRGANMGILRVDHPDIREFIDCKRDVSRLTNFNVSVAVTDDFVAAARSGSKYDLVHPSTGRVAGQEDAAAIFDTMVENAWRTGEPGIFFIDRAEAANPVPFAGHYEATNPCGEQPLLPYDVCNLGSVNLGRFVSGPTRPGADPGDAVDWTGLGRAVELGVRFLDNVIDANRYPLQQIADLAARIRRIGLGVMGWADMLVRLGIRYDSQQAADFASSVMGFIEERARRASERLADERGEFPEWERSVWGPDGSCARSASGERIRPRRKLRNCNVTTVAPTGTISIIAGCSSGIEPLFAIAFTRKQAGEVMRDVNDDFAARGLEEGWYDDDLAAAVADAGSLDVPGVPDEVKAIFVTAHDISPEWHVRMQAAFQEHVDSAVSKTTNFPHHATRSDVRKIFDLAHDLGCKGITVYRDGSRPGQVLSTGKTGAGEETASHAMRLLEEELARTSAELGEARDELARTAAAGEDAPAPRDRPGVLTGQTFKIISPLGDLYVTVNEDERGAPFEVFCTLGKAGGAAMADTEAIGRLISLALRSGVSLDRIVRQLRGISCDRAVGFGANKVLSVPDAIAQTLESYRESRATGQERLPFRKTVGAVPIEALSKSRLDASLLGGCPDCGSSQMAYEEGCANCHVCGYSECF